MDEVLDRKVSFIHISTEFSTYMWLIEDEEIREKILITYAGHTESSYGVIRPFPVL